MGGTMDRGMGRRGGVRWIAVGLLAGLVSLALGCVSVAEFRKLERQVRDMQRGGMPGGMESGETRVADLAAEVDGLQTEVRRIEGRLEVSEHRSEQALAEARAARASSAGADVTSDAEAPAGDEAPASPEPGRPAGGDPDEVDSYRTAYDAWRRGDSEACVERFRDFLQTYPASAHADDASYWLADCYFKQGDYKTAVLRFDDVVSRYPTGNRAPDALYRQGEALLRLGPGYGKAAGKAFERVLKEYPDSGRATEAKRQLDLLGSG
jgi:tol-pal system protein YbgF